MKNAYKYNFVTRFSTIHNWDGNKILTSERYEYGFTVFTFSIYRKINKLYYVAMKIKNNQFII